MRFVAGLVVACSLSAFGCSSSDFNVASGDGGTSDTSVDDVSNGDGGGCTGTSCPCPDPTFRCGLKCVDRSTDPEHCGACADKCPVPPGGSATCKLGICGLGCASGTHACGAVCVSDTSPNSCGASCTPCPSGANASPACSAGKCALACHAGFADCDGDPSNGCETDLNTPAHCGGCSKPCPTGDVCQPDGAGGFKCSATCTLPNILCGSACVDVTKDPANCGTCGNVCHGDDHGEPTCGGTPPACGLKCDTGFHACAAGCTSDSDKSACGPKCLVCAGGAHASPFCDAATGTCKLTCDAGFADCDGDPTNGCEVDLNNDPSNCSKCGEVCTAPTGGTATCSGGGCSFACQPGWLQLHGVGCAVFGGVSGSNVISGGTGCSPCPVPDPLAVGAPACACPSGFSAEPMVLASAYGCSVPSPLTFCYAPPPATLPPTVTPPDFTGAFLSGDACGTDCQVPNPYTKTCSCPTGSATMTTDVMFLPSCSGAPPTPLPGKLGICAGPGAPVTLFGAYASDDAGKCVANVGAVTVSGSTCSCTGGTTTKYAIAIAAGRTGVLAICYP